MYGVITIALFVFVSKSRIDSGIALWCVNTAWYPSFVTLWKENGLSPNLREYNTFVRMTRLPETSLTHREPFYVTIRSTVELLLVQETYFGVFNFSMSRNCDKSLTKWSVAPVSPRNRIPFPLPTSKHFPLALLLLFGRTNLKSIALVPFTEDEFCNMTLTWIPTPIAIRRCLWMTTGNLGRRIGSFGRPNPSSSAIPWCFGVNGISYPFARARRIAWLPFPDVFFYPGSRGQCAMLTDIIAKYYGLILYSK